MNNKFQALMNDQSVIPLEFYYQIIHANLIQHWINFVPLAQTSQSTWKLGDSSGCESNLITNFSGFLEGNYLLNTQVQEASHCFIFLNQIKFGITPILTQERKSAGVSCHGETTEEVLSEVSWCCPDNLEKDSSLHSVIV